MGHEKLTGILSVLPKDKIPLDAIAAEYGFNKFDVIELMDQEFRRIHSGVGVENFRLKYFFELARKSKDYKGVSDNRIQLEMLLTFEALIEKKPGPTPKQIKDHIKDIDEMQMPYENRVKRIRSRITRVDIKKYKAWLKIALPRLPK